MTRLLSSLLLATLALGCGGSIVEIQTDGTYGESSLGTPGGSTEGAGGTSAPQQGSPPAEVTVTAPQGGTGATTQGLSAQEQELAQLINVERAQRGLSQVTIDPILDCAVRRHSDDIGPKQICGHTGSDGSQPGDRVQGCNGTGWNGEIVACGQQTPAAAVQAWLDSPGHRVIMLDPSQRSVGVAMTDNYWTAIFKQ